MYSSYLNMERVSRKETGEVAKPLLNVPKCGNKEVVKLLMKI